jgi:NAD(P)-dependent dehydrogenase (short-subunit alcohol dehydrogenase family)
MTADTQDFSEKVVVITGAARGLGAAMARQLSARGARLALLGLEAVELQQVSDACPGSRPWLVDVTDQQRLTDVAAEVADHFGRVDVLVVNAGVATGGPFRLAEARSYDRVLEVNLLGSIRTLRAFLPALVESRGYGLQIASLAALVPAPMLSAYCASKTGVEAFIESVRTEVAHLGVDLGVAYLSWTDTDMVRGADEREGMRRSRAEMPGVLGRTYPLEPTVTALCDGIARRSAHVYGQPWVRLLRPIRGLVTGLLHVGGKRRMAEAEASTVSDGPAGLVGAGGRADEEHQGRSVTLP